MKIRRRGLIIAAAGDTLAFVTGGAIATWAPGWAEFAPAVAYLSGSSAQARRNLPPSTTYGRTPWDLLSTISRQR